MSSGRKATFMVALFLIGSLSMPDFDEQLPEKTSFFDGFSLPWGLMPSTSRWSSPATMSCKKDIRLGSAFLAGALVFLVKHELQKLWCSGRAGRSCGVRVGVPSRGLLFSKKNMPRQKLCLSGRRS